MKNLLSMLFVFSALMGFGGEDIHEDALIWLRGDSDVNGDGFISTDETVDALSPVHSDAIKPYGWLAGTSGGSERPLGDLVWTNDVIVVPYTRRTIPNALSYCFRQSLRSSDGASWANSILMSEVASKITSNSWSCHMRFKWAGSKMSSSTTKQFLLMAGKVEGESMTQGLNWAVDTSGNFVCSIGSDAFMSYNTQKTSIESNLWTDVVWVFNDGGNMRIYVMQEGKDLVSKTVTCSNKNYRPKSTGGFYVGNNQKGQWEQKTGAIVCNSFRGQINQLAVWNRAFSDDEVKRVLSWPCEDLIRAGIANGKDDEFNGEGEASAEALDADCGWSAFGGPIAAGGSKSVSFTVPLRFNGLPQLLRWRGAANSASGTLELKANGTVVDTQDVNPGKWTYFSVPGSCFVTDAVTTLTLTRTDAGANPLRTDALAVGGSWQVGKIGPSGQETWEFGSMGITPETAYVADGNFKNVRDHFEAGYGERLKFDVPMGVAGFYKYNVKFRSVFEAGTSAGRQNVRFVAYVNGMKVYDEARDYGAWYDREFKIKSNLLHVGENEIRLVNEGDPSGASGYFSFDYVQLQIGKPQRGIVLVVR